MKTFIFTCDGPYGEGYRARIEAHNDNEAHAVFARKCPNHKILRVDRWYETIDEVIQANYAIEQSWFGVAEMHVFQSRVHDVIYGGRFFVTSEKGPDGIRRYTVREALQTGEIGTVGEFQGYASRNAAHAAAKRAATS